MTTISIPYRAGEKIPKEENVMALYLDALTVQTRNIPIMGGEHKGLEKVPLIDDIEKTCDDNGVLCELRGAYIENPVRVWYDSNNLYFDMDIAKFDKFEKDLINTQRRVAADLYCEYVHKARIEAKRHTEEVLFFDWGNLECAEELPRMNARQRIKMTTGIV